ESLAARRYVGHGEPAPRHVHHHDGRDGEDDEIGQDSHGGLRSRGWVGPHQRISSCTRSPWVRLEVSLVPSDMVMTYSPCPHGSIRRMRSIATMAERCTRTKRSGSSLA